MSRWESLLAVQALDTRLDQLAVKREGLPQRARLAEVRAAIAEVDERRNELPAASSDSGRGGLLTERAAQARSAVLRLVTNSRELQALQDDVA